jgi:hypothetical protein
VANPPTHPQVINSAFELLTGSPVTAAPEPAGRAGGAAPRASPPPAGEDPLGAVVALCRALWEVMHVHALGRRLAKPFKVACALRNVLLLADVPLYARRARGATRGARPAAFAAR